MLGPYGCESCFRSKALNDPTFGLGGGESVSGWRGGEDERGKSEAQFLFFIAQDALGHSKAHSGGVTTSWSP
jgi:hypothetical protein